jgi:hypothetical protein
MKHKQAIFQQMFFWILGFFALCLFYQTKTKLTHANRKRKMFYQKFQSRINPYRLQANSSAPGLFCQTKASEFAYFDTPVSLYGVNFGRPYHNVPVIEPWKVVHPRMFPSGAEYGGQ